jgi:hypothetical protein
MKILILAATVSVLDVVLQSGLAGPVAAALGIFAVLSFFFATPLPE